MKFVDIVSGRTLETENETVISQYKKYSERYKEVKEEKPKDKKAKTE